MQIRAQRPPAWVALPLVAMTLATARVASAQAGAKSDAASSIDVPKIAITQFTLPNGLRVVLHEDHSTPIVAVQTWYNVGSKNDVAGKTGLAHMFEHLYDEGTTHLSPDDYRQIVQQTGGAYNATTTDDATEYYTVVPSNQLETVLWLEGDRMANLRITKERFESERNAVRNEYRFRILPNSVQRMAVAMNEAMFAGTAYGLGLFGNVADLDTTTVDDLLAYRKKFYVPNNAVLVVAGDLVPADAKRLIAKYFGGVPRGPAVAQPAVPAPLTAERRVVMQSPTGTAKQLWIGWRGVRGSDPDRVALVALGDILQSRTDRLLITDRKLATPGSAENVLMFPAGRHFDLEFAGILQTAHAVTGSMTEVERLIDSVVTSIQTDGVTPQELHRWVATARLSALTDLLGVQSKARNLGDGATTQGNPLAIFNEVDRQEKLTPADIQRVARKYLVPQRVVLNLVPAGKLDQISKPDLPYTTTPWR